MLQDGGAMTAAADGVVKDTTTQGFMQDVIEESKRQPVLVDFWAPWCGPCKQLTPVLEKAVKAAKGKVKLVKMNIDEHPAIPGQMGIQSIPAVIAFVNGQPADGFMGALPESQVIAFLERLTKEKIGGEEQDLLKAADAALVDGDPAAAAEIYAQLLAADSGNVHAWPASRAAMSRPARSTRPSRRSTWCRRPNATRPGRRRPRRARGCRAGASRLGRSPSSRKRCWPIRSIIRRASISPSRSMPRASAPRRSSISWRSSRGIANGTTTAPASSWCSSSKPGARPTRPTVEGRKKLSSILFS